MNPELAIVVGTRNDGYGDRQQGRVAAHARSVDRFADALGLPLEYLVVEWSPLPGWPRLADTLPPVGSPLVTRRIIHAEGPEVDAVIRVYVRSFHEWAAKNAGLRRARAPFVAVTNQDIIFLPELASAVRAWMESDLAASTYARCDRLDIEVAPEEAYPELLCLGDAIPHRHELHARARSTRLHEQGFTRLFRSGSRPMFNRELHGDLVVTRNSSADPAADPMSPDDFLHTNASGDFLVASTQNLIEAGGFAEGIRWRGHLDSLSLGRLWAYGLGQVILPLPAVVVHVDHRIDSVLEPAWHVVAPVLDQILLGEPYPDQPETWGLATAGLDETVATVAGAEGRRSGPAPSPAASDWSRPARLEDFSVPEDVREALEELRVYRPDSPKVRLGCRFDGGYVIPARLLQAATRLVSIGISNDSSFEEDWFERTGRPVRMFDGSGPCPGICARFPSGDGTAIAYHRQHVGNAAGQIRLADALAGPPGAILKMDAEGAEYQTIPGVDLSVCAGIVLEVHFLDEADYRRRLAAMLRQIGRDFVLVHLHGNNCCPCVPLPRALQGVGEGLPRVMELTFVNRQLHGVPLELDDARFPLAGLDAPNDTPKPDLPLRWVNRY